MVTREELFRTYASPDMGLMQIILLKETDPVQGIPFLIECFLARQDAPEELRHACRLSILRLLDSGVAPGLVRSLRSGTRRWRYFTSGGPAYRVAARKPRERQKERRLISTAWFDPFRTWMSFPRSRVRRIWHGHSISP